MRTLLIPLAVLAAYSAAMLFLALLMTPRCWTFSQSAQTYASPDCFASAVALPSNPRYEPGGNGAASLEAPEIERYDELQEY